LKPASVIASHANKVGTEVGGGAQQDRGLIKATKVPVHVPLSGKTTSSTPGQVHGRVDFGDTSPTGVRLADSGEKNEEQMDRLAERHVTRVADAAHPGQTPRTQNMAVPLGPTRATRRRLSSSTRQTQFKTRPPTPARTAPTIHVQPIARWRAAAGRRRGQLRLGPTHAPAPGTTPKDGVPKGTVTSFTCRREHDLTDLIRDDVPGCGTADHDHDDGAGRQVEHDRLQPSGTWTRTIDVYVPPT
jgi:hypothetical protein